MTRPEKLAVAPRDAPSGRYSGRRVASGSLVVNGSGLAAGSERARPTGRSSRFPFAALSATGAGRDRFDGPDLVRQGRPS